MKLIRILERKIQADETVDTPYDAYKEATGEEMSLEFFVSLRALEHRLIELGHLDESDLHPVPDYLAPGWYAYVEQHPETEDISLS